MYTKSKTSLNPANPTAALSANVPVLEELTLNWHITEACNYRCRYCYAKWTDGPDPREIGRASCRERV